MVTVQPLSKICMQRGRRFLMVKTQSAEEVGRRERVKSEAHPSLSTYSTTTLNISCIHRPPLLFFLTSLVSHLYWHPRPLTTSFSSHTCLSFLGSLLLHLLFLLRWSTAAYLFTSNFLTFPYSQTFAFFFLLKKCITKKCPWLYQEPFTFYHQVSFIYIWY